MGRPVSVSDDAIFAATARAIARTGPAKLTLAHVAKAVGLTPAALVKRFGSKRELLLGFVKHAPDAADGVFATARAAHPASPLAALIASATSVADHVRSPAELANSLAFLQIDLSDAAFRRPVLRNSERILAGYEALVRDAIAAGELVDCDAPLMARALQAITGGSLVNWVIHREGNVTAFVKRDIETLIGPLRRPQAK